MAKPFGALPQIPAMTATPTGNPPGGALLLYFKSDGKLYSKSSTGVESAISPPPGAADLTATGTRDATTFLRGDNTWAVPEGGGSAAGIPTFRVKARGSSNVSTMSGTTTLGGVGLVVGDRVLLVAQATASQNGIWVIQTGAWTRAPEADTAAKIAGSIVYIEQGSTDYGQKWHTTFTTTETVGTHPMLWYLLRDSTNTTLMTQAEAETGTATSERVMSAQRVKQAIDYNTTVFAVEVATTTNITLSGTGTQIDGEFLITGIPVLVKNQTNPAQNGIYLTASGTWPRHLNYNSATKIAGMLVRVRKGAINGGTRWSTSFKSTDSFGFDSMSWARLDGTLTGEVKMWPVATAPAGYLKCDGATYQKSAHPDLGELLNPGAATTFTVPTTEDLFPIGASATRPVGTTGGDAKIAATALPPHTHDSGNLVAQDAGEHSHDTKHSDSTGGSVGNIPKGTTANSQNSANTVLPSGRHFHPMSGNTGTGPNASDATQTEHRGPWFAMNFIIKT